MESARMQLIRQLRNENKELTLRDAFNMVQSEEYSEKLSQLTESIYQETLEALTEQLFQVSPLKYSICHSIAKNLMMKFDIKSR